MSEPRIELKKIEHLYGVYYLRVIFGDDRWGETDTMPEAIIDSIITTFNKGLLFDELKKKYDDLRNEVIRHLDKTDKHFEKIGNLLEGLSNDK